MEIKILGMGCPKCKRVERLAREAASEIGANATFTKVENMGAIMAHDVMSTPALVIDEEVKGSGRIPAITNSGGPNSLRKKPVES